LGGQERRQAVRRRGETPGQVGGERPPRLALMARPGVMVDEGRGPPLPRRVDLVPQMMGQDRAAGEEVEGGGAQERQGRQSPQAGLGGRAPPRRLPLQPPPGGGGGGGGGGSRRPP